ncbi:DUF6115 domain-containing protein [Sporanaerobacter acetigenes]|uniref:Uncharacterized protein n=1 Tax=Sporanaerobacter acetigenes DSM 13106 TaxID=1123281 RepID=A0A1M5XJ99_9FIRM|nr:hypothetical protein [Sporanaerobacter acetigenes]SHH99702.1 hypothetical protein SAMN02745180_01682 [Sporanaerobacter acetigenes DSM 13106]
MIYRILLIIGIFLVIISLIYIKKINKSEEERYNEIVGMYSDINEYRRCSTELMDNIESLVDSTIVKINNNSEKVKYIDIDDHEVEEKNKINLFNVSDKFNNNEDLTEKVLTLNGIGLNNKEIAQKLGRGVREIDIILNMNENNKYVK